MKRIILCPNPVRDVNFACTEAVKHALQNRGIIPVVYPLHYVQEEWQEPEGDELEALCQQIKDADLLICFGGDGTILHLARVTAPYQIPILTVNLGRKGFIAELEPKDTEKIAQIAAEEDYPIQKRMMIDVTVHRGGELVHRGFALNDAVISGKNRLIGVEVRGDGQLISRFSGDGIIVCTPTGSTAYSMAAGGPIIEPTAENLTITPICAHALMAKSFVLAPDRKVTVRVRLMGSREGYLSVDGGSFGLEDQDEITITRSKNTTRLVKASEWSFYQIVSDKLGEVGNS